MSQLTKRALPIILSAGILIVGLAILWVTAKLTDCDPWIQNSHYYLGTFWFWMVANNPLGYVRVLAEVFLLIIGLSLALGGISLGILEITGSESTGQ